MPLAEFLCQFRTEPIGNSPGSGGGDVLLELIHRRNLCEDVFQNESDASLFGISVSICSICPFRWALRNKTYERCEFVFTESLRDFSQQRLVYVVFLPEHHIVGLLRWLE